MRDAACREWIELFENRPFVFLTGDLGFKALEPLRDVMGESFINAGLAEQNMVSVAAGLASRGLDSWVYSIAPFCYARPFEQIRNDICLHGLPVKLVGNGGGYAYGSMGATHHALEDYAAMLCLQEMQVYVPAFSEDLSAMIPKLAESEKPAYLRLARCEKPGDLTLPDYAPWRNVMQGEGPVVVGVGPVVGSLLAALKDRGPQERPEVWVLSELPLNDESLPADLLAALRRSRRLCVMEEHVEQGGVGQALAHALLRQGITLDGYRHLCALGYTSGDYGSQAFHRRECGLDPASIIRELDHLRS